MPVENVTLLLNTARDVMQEDYGDNYVWYNCQRRDGSGILRMLESMGSNSDVTMRGKGLVFYLRNQLRAVPGYAGNTDYTLAHLGNSGEDGDTIRATWDEIYMRSTIPGQELRNWDLGGDGMRQFINAWTQILEDHTTVFNHIFPFTVLRDGSCTLGSFSSGAGQTINAGVTADVPVDDVIGFMSGIRVDVIDSGGSLVSNGNDLLVGNSSVFHGAGTVQITNTGGSNVTIPVGATFRLPKSVTMAAGHGLDYLIDDGTEFADYPKNVRSNSKVDRSTSAYPALKSQIITPSSSPVKIKREHLDRLVQKVMQNGQVSSVSADENAEVPRFAYYFFCTIAHYYALMKEARASASAGNIFGTTYDMGVQRTTYRDIPFVHHEFFRSDRLYMPKIDEIAYRAFKKLAPITNGELGYWQRAYAADEYEFTQSHVWQMIAKQLVHSGKLKDVTGETV